jgi:hypothetical protein
MKTLGKLKINPEKLLIDDELKSLKGGWCGYIYVDCPSGAWSGAACDETESEALEVCMGMWGQYGCTCYAYG